MKRTKTLAPSPRHKRDTRNRDVDKAGVNKSAQPKKQDYMDLPEMNMGREGRNANILNRKKTIQDSRKKSVFVTSTRKQVN